MTNTHEDQRLALAKEICRHHAESDLSAQVLGRIVRDNRDLIVASLRISVAPDVRAAAEPPTDTNKVWQAAEACWASSAPEAAVNVLYYEILRLIGQPVTGLDINAVSAAAEPTDAMSLEELAEWEDNGNYNAVR
jgi:hypothetical protein